MAPADRYPNRRASPMPASDTHTTRDELEPTRVERTTLPGDRPGDRPQTPRDAKASEQLTRRLDVSGDPRFAPEAPARRRDPRTTDIFPESPDVVGAPERTVVAPLPPRHVEVEPIPDAASTNGARIAAEVEERRARRARDEAQREAARRRRDEPRREKPESRETDREVALEPARNPAKEKTQPSVSTRDAVRPRGQRRREPAPQDEVSSGHELVHSPTRIDRIRHDSPWSRLGVALRDVSHAIAVSAKEGWHTLRHEGVGPFFDKATPQLVHGWHKVRDLALRLRLAAVAKAAEMGFVKPKRRSEFEQEGDDRLDESRVEAWRRFHKGKTSSSYLQDDE